MTAIVPFAERLHEAIDRKRSPLAVGLDPVLDRLPPEVLRAARDRHGERPAGVTAALELFCGGVLEAVEPWAAAVKVNIAFFEQYHLPGLVAYAGVLAEARRRGFLVIGDIKRSDIGSTAEAYAAGHLTAGPGGAASFAVDAVTLNPYLGRDGIVPFIRTAVRHGGGVYVLVRTSNPSSVELQQLPVGADTVAGHVAELVARWGAEVGPPDGYAPVGAVVGATFPGELAALRARMPRTPWLVPGYGAQGGRAEDLRAVFDARGHGALVNASRSILYAYSTPARTTSGAGAWKDAVAQAARQAAEELEAVRHAGS
ncbi:MAG: orotidine-5'-phosphate decarboxylase [Planctomycetes bacterium]|nr:orotidine-5'-phosphate decarboxylase [Planctomycetota bacterium]